ncbi:helix-turn-helix transcriptional regulator [Kutzneria buriramensis]|uniref:DNA-binding transcriptional ArsR family regulator n=1 Tax=Kutzneria buriramensis TaxID=1045776 RepID=A0A3E0HUI0_9PSEU|nr:ArsR family transcriptional regulator [Kutzneria buriramensis]REH50061.1 DNA-binding transcriptional ArsR family regulator [Kutzneria buriramensis]
MLRVHLHAEDLARVRFATAPAPVLETAMILLELRNRPQSATRGHHDWRPRARSALSSSARPLVQLVPSQHHALYLDVLTTDAEQAFQLVRDTATSVHAENLTRIAQIGVIPIPTWLRRYADGDTGVLDALDDALRAFHTTCLAQLWPTVTARFHDDITHRMTTLGAHGLAAMISTLSPDLCLTGTTITARYPWDRDVHLHGHGLILMPSAFWTGHPRITWDPQDPSQHVLIYPARTNYRTTTGPIMEKGDALAGLVGATRAAVLRALAQPSTTSGLAGHVGISVSSASEHTTALRNAGLVTSHRLGQAVHHHLTHLGISVLMQH